MQKETDIPELGLQPTEKAIIKAVEYSPRNISDIARDTKIPRTSLLYMLKKLQRRKLVIQKKQGRRTLWESNLTVASKQMPDKNITVYRGVPTIFKIMEEWTTLPKNTRVVGIQPDKSIKQSLRKNSLSNWLRINEGIKHNSLIIEGIVHEKSVNSIISEVGKDKAKKIFDSFVGRLEDYVKIPDEFADVESEIYICKGSAYIINWNKEIAIGIHDKDMTNLLMSMFSCVKEMGTRYSQNEKMKQYKETLRNVNINNATKR
jgi:hypothetical protein